MFFRDLNPSKRAWSPERSTKAAPFNNWMKGTICASVHCVLLRKSQAQKKERFRLIGMPFCGPRVRRAVVTPRSPTGGWWRTDRGLSRSAKWLRNATVATPRCRFPNPLCKQSAVFPGEVANFRFFCQFHIHTSVPVIFLSIFSSV